MSNGDFPDHVALAVRLVEEATQLRISCAWETVNGFGSWALRFRADPDAATVAIYLSCSPYTATASLVPDTFSRSLLRLVGSLLATHKREWSETIAEMEGGGTQVGINVNGVPRVPADADAEEWDSLEIEANTRIAPPGGEGPRGRALARSATAVLSLFLVCLERSEAADIDLDGLPEGALRLELSRRYERNATNRMRCLNHFGFDCFACGFNFESAYGDLGSGFAEVHHIIPVSSMGAGYRPNPTTDMVPLCANCHRMVHRTDPPMAPLELRRRLVLDRADPSPTA